MLLMTKQFAKDATGSIALLKKHKLLEVISLQQWEIFRIAL